MGCSEERNTSTYVFLLLLLVSTRGRLSQENLTMLLECGDVFFTVKKYILLTNILLHEIFFINVILYSLFSESVSQPVLSAQWLLNYQNVFHQHASRKKEKTNVVVASNQSH